MFAKFRERIGSSLRNKLFALVLLPTVLAMITTLGYTFYWFNSFTRDNLFLKAKADLALAQQSIQQVGRERYLAALQRLADSYEFRAMIRNSDAASITRALKQLQKEQTFAFLHVTGELGNWLFEGNQQKNDSSKPTPLTSRAVRGLTGMSLEVFTAENLRREDPGLLSRARLGVKKNAGQQIYRAPQPARVPVFEERALILRMVYPVTDKQGNLMAVLDGGVMINNDTEVVNAVRDRIYGAGTLPTGGLGVVEFMLDDVTVSSNIPNQQGTDSVGGRAAQEIRQKVLENGEMLVNRSFHGGQWYISGYAPLFDVHDRGVGVLHAGFLEAPYRRAYYWAALLHLLILLALFSASAWVAYRGAKRILKPVGQMMAVVRATQAGLERRIGEIDSRDELRELARQFDSMLDLLQQRNREIQRAAAELETKVEERTHELEMKNTDLEATVDLLHKTRQQLVMAEKLAAVGELAAGVAHDIHNPTAVILGNLDILATELGSAIDPVRTEIDLIMQQVERIRHIVNRLLQFSRPSRETGEVVEVEINQLIKNTVPLVRHMVEERSITFRQRLAATRLIRINPYDLEAVLINLTINAYHAVSPGGIVEISTADWDHRGVVISVRDDGIGIPPEMLHRIFDQFFTTDPQRRTGLGLSISYGLIHRYGGDITVESEPGKGSVFHVWLPQEPVFAPQLEVIDYSLQA